MEKEKYKTRKQRSMEMLKSGVEPIKDGFNESLGKFLLISGRVVKNEMFDRIELMANNVREGDYKDALRALEK